LVEPPVHRRGRRLLYREALPWIAILACWALVATTAGLPAAATLIAAQILTRSARDIAAHPGIKSKQRLVLGFVAIALLAGLCQLTSNDQIATSMLILAAGLPTYRLHFEGHRRRINNHIFIPLRAWCVLAAVMCVAAVSPISQLRLLTSFSIAIVAGQWAAWLIAMTIGNRKGDHHAFEPKHYAAVAQRRAAMRAIKLILTAAFGPLGNAMFRLVRSGTGLRSWLAGREINSRVFLVSGLSALVASIMILALATGPFLPVIAAGFLRLAINAKLASHLLRYSS
jgi:hypothetical protein